MERILKQILSILSPAERKKFRWMMALTILVSIADIAALALLLLVIQFYIQPSLGSYLDRLPTWLSDRTSIALISAFLLLFSIKNFAAFLLHKAQYRFVYEVAARLAEKNLLQYLEGDFPDHVNTDSSVFFRRIQQQPLEFCYHILAGMQQIITQLVLVAATVLAIMLFNIKLFFLLFVLLLPPVILVAWLVKRRLHSVRTNSKASSERSLQYLKEALAGYVESNIYDRHDFFKSRYITYQAKFNRHLADLQIVQGLPGRMIEVFAVLGLLIVIAISEWSSNQGIDLITTGAFIAAAYKIIPGIVKIMNAASQIRAFEFTIRELLPSNSTEQKGKNIKEDIRSIEFRNISFRYKEQSVLDNLNFKVEKGDFIGIDGVSGIGKTTIINLLLGFLETEKGDILFNGMETKAGQRQCFWEDISYAKQQPFLIHDTVLNNITLGEERYDKERLSEVLRITGLEELTGRYAGGIQQVIAENGKDISGGQRQRVVIARGLYKQAGLFILDEPFNELDDASEKKLLRYFRGLADEGKIVILITHNHESFSFCNKMISLNEQ